MGNVQISRHGQERPSQIVDKEFVADFLDDLLHWKVQIDHMIRVAATWENILRCSLAVAPSQQLNEKCTQRQPMLAMIFRNRGRNGEELVFQIDHFPAKRE